MGDELYHVYAISNGNKIVSAAEAIRTDIHTCIDCKQELILHRGKIKIPHFAHYPGEANCNPESWLHKTAKYLIWQYAHDKKLNVLTHCYSCLAEREKLVTEFDRVRVEFKTDKFIVDVALIKQEKIVGAIEVFVTHECTSEKLSYFIDQRIPFIEVMASDVLKQPNCLKPLKRTLTICSICVPIARSLQCYATNYR